MGVRIVSLIPPSSAASGAEVIWEALSGLWHSVEELISVWDVENTHGKSTLGSLLLLACPFTPPDSTEAGELALFQQIFGSSWDIL